MDIEKIQLIHYDILKTIFEFLFVVAIILFIFLIIIRIIAKIKNIDNKRIKRDD